MIKSNEAELTRTWIIIAASIVVSGLFISSFKLLTPYSYWLDELYSVNASALHWGGLHQRLLSDVHPPLYQVILKLWMDVFGDTEPTTRALSWLFAIGSLVVALRFAAQQGGVFLYSVAVCFSANMLFAFYANETRAYAMMLLLSTLLLTLFPFRRSQEATNGFFLTAVLLSLTHYFGLILAGISLAIILLQNAKTFGMLVKTVAAGLICLIWPLHHILNGSIASKTGGNFWIQIGSPLETFSKASSSVIAGTGNVWAVIFIISLAICATICFLKKKAGSADDRVANVGFTCAAVVLAIVLLLALVDRYTPMSTTRNGLDSAFRTPS